MTTNKNLDSRINEYSFEMVKALNSNNESLSIIDKALGVLSNDGVYGYYIYCKSKSKGVSIIFKKFIKGIVDEFNGEFKVPICNDAEGKINYDKYFVDLSENIHELLFFKDILEKILIYARYHAKAYGDKNE